jgi:hypothetical protein
MHFILRVTASILALPIAAYSISAKGTVIDPHLRVIEGARVRLTCGKATRDQMTDAEGHFEFPSLPSFATCTLAVTHAGFEPFEQPLGENLAHLTINLRIAADRRVIDVTTAQDIREIAQSSIGSVSVSGAELQSISNSTGDLISYAKALAGADTSADAIYVDGLPSAALPPANMIARIDVNTDPFSAEYSDSDKTHINITTKNADRPFHVNFGGAGLGVGGGNPLAPELRSVTHSANFGLTGGIPQLPLSFSLHGNLGSLQNDQPIEAVTSVAQTASRLRPAVVGNRNASGQFNLHYAASESSQADFSFADSGASGFNVGVGGLTLPDAGSASLIHTREGRLTFTIADQCYVYRGGFVFDGMSSLLKANSSALGVTVAGAFVDGGAPITRSQSRRTSWTWKNVFQSSARHHLFSAGFTVTRSGISNTDQPNAFGAIDFSSLPAYAAAQAGSPTGTLFLTQGNGQTHYANTEVAPFVQGELLHHDNLLVIGGVRADYQSRGNVLVSPRLSVAARKGAFVFRGGAGRFVHEWPGIVFIHVIENDGLHLRSFIIDDVSLAQASGPILPFGGFSGNPVIERLSPNLTQPRDWIFRASIERPVGRFTPGLEYTSVNGQHLLGSERIPELSGLLDVLESNRTRRRQQLNVKLRFPWRAHNITAHYQWIRSRDNSSGPFSFPEYQGDLAAEWARSAGISPQNFTLVDNFTLPGKVSLNLIASSRGSSPYNITTGLENGDGLYNDRGGRPRNSGNGPRYNSLNVWGYRRIPLPIGAKPEKRIYFDLGVQVNNLLGNKNYTSIDSVTNSPLFGTPLTAGPARALRFWLNLL